MLVARRRPPPAGPVGRLGEPRPGGAEPRGSGLADRRPLPALAARPPRAPPGHRGSLDPSIVVPAPRPRHSGSSRAIPAEAGIHQPRPGSPDRTEWSAGQRRWLRERAHLANIASHPRTRKAPIGRRPGRRKSEAGRGRHFLRVARDPPGQRRPVCSLKTEEKTNASAGGLVGVLSGAAYPAIPDCRTRVGTLVRLSSCGGAGKYHHRSTDRRFGAARRHGPEMLTESLILAQDERWRRA